MPSPSRRDTYQLCQWIKGHQDDTKAIVALTGGRYATGSRDRSVKIWSSEATADSEPLTSYIDHAKYVNSLLYVSQRKAFVEDPYAGLLISGSSDSTLSIFDVAKGETIGALLGHEGNVCSLSNCNLPEALLISTSWDGSAIVWSARRPFDPLYRLRGDKNVPMQKVIHLGRTDPAFLSVSSDLSIKLWNGERVVFTVETAHSQAIRDVTLFSEIDPDIFVVLTVSNDGSIAAWNVNTKKPSIRRVGYLEAAHSSFIYSCALWIDPQAKYDDEGELFTAGEDRCVKVWRCTRDAEGTRVDIQPAQTISLPASSIWMVACDGASGDLLCACSQGRIATFSKKERTAASVEVQAEFERCLAEQKIQSHEMAEELRKAKPASELPNMTGTSEGQTILAREDDGTVSAYRWTSPVWTKIGTVVDPGSSKGGTEYEGKQWDFVFQADIDGGNIPLPFNRGDNPYDAATGFIAKHSLNPDYHQEIVDFLIKNGEASSTTKTSSKSPRIDSTGSNRNVKYEAFNGQAARSKILSGIPGDDLCQFVCSIFDALEQSKRIPFVPAQFIHLFMCISTDSRFAVIDLLRKLVLHSEDYMDFVCSTEEAADLLADGVTLDDAGRISNLSRAYFRLYTNILSDPEAAEHVAILGVVRQFLESVPSSSLDFKDSAIYLGNLALNYLLVFRTCPPPLHSVLIRLGASLAQLATSWGKAEELGIPKFLRQAVDPAKYVLTETDNVDLQAFIIESVLAVQSFLSAALDSCADSDQKARITELKTLYNSFG